MPGFIGQLLRINLSSGLVMPEPLDVQASRLYIGGAGLAARILYDETDALTDPLGSDNRLIFMTGPLTGTRAPTSGRHAVAARSPLTGGWGEADSGGSWGVALKRAGFDGIIVQGTSPKPVYLLVSDGEAALLPAEDLWGLDTYATDAALKARHGDGCITACIGPAGERLIPFAGIFNDGRHARAAGRSGLGAVMGAKRLKAIVALGSQKVQVADDARLLDSVRRLVPGIRKSRAQLGAYGTAGGIVTNAALADMPAGNWRVGDWVAGAERLSGERMAETILAGKYHCWGCPIGCGRNIKITSGPHAGVEGAGPEYEALAALGALCLVDDLEAVAHANELCNRYGMDVIAAGSAIAFALEAQERGLIEAPADLVLEWGNPETVIRLVEDMGERRGLGELLSLGVARMAEVLGGEAEEMAQHVKGQELPFHDPRALASLAVAYATHPRGACHRGNSHLLERQAAPVLGYPEAFERFGATGKGAMTARLQDYSGLYNSLKLCQFIMLSVEPADVVDWLNAATGWELSIEEFMTAGERISNLKRMFNVRLGFSRKDDTLPSRILHMPLAEGSAKGALPDLETMLDEYYEHREWDRDGLPTPDKLRQLGLHAEVADLPE